jgi:hypothetical protein
MRRFRRGSFALLTGLALGGLVFNGTSASAIGAGGGQFVGSGTITPGLTLTPQPVSGAISGTLVGAGEWNNPTVIEDSCSFSFNGSSDDLATGAGSASGACSGTATVTASFSYTRAAGALVASGSASVNGFATSIIIVCSFMPTSASPVTSFAIICYPYIN